MPSRFRQSQRAVDAAADAVTALLDGGALRVYSGPQPASADAAVPATAVLLVECRFGRRAFAGASGGVARANELAPATARANGAPSWCRAVAADGRVVFDGSVGLEGDRADLTLPVATVIAGAEVVITDCSYTQPKAQGDA